MNIDYDLVSRFAQWLIPLSDDNHSASALLRAAQNRSQMVGKRIEIAWNNSGLRKENLEQAFDEDEIADLFTIPARPDPNYDYTKNSRTRRRRQELNQKAQSLGFKSLSDMLTKWKNGEIDLEVNKESTL